MRTKVFLQLFVDIIFLYIFAKILLKVAKQRKRLKNNKKILLLWVSMQTKKSKEER